MQSQAAQGDIALAMLVELAGIVIITLVAGISDEVANIIILFLIGLWLLWMMKHVQQTGFLNQLLLRVQKATVG